MANGLRLLKCYLEHFFNDLHPYLTSSTFADSRLLTDQYLADSISNRSIFCWSTYCWGDFWQNPLFVLYDARSIYIFIQTLDTTLTNIAAFTKRASKKSQQNTWPCQLKNASTSHPVNLLFDLKQSVSLNFSFRCFIISLILLQ